MSLAESMSAHREALGTSLLENAVLVRYVWPGSAMAQAMAFCPVSMLQEASDIVLDQPVLLTLSSEGLTNKLTSLAAAASLRLEWQQQMEAVQPKTLAAWLCFSSTR